MSPWKHLWIVARTKARSIPANPPPPASAPNRLLAIVDWLGCSNLHRSQQSISTRHVAKVHKSGAAYRQIYIGLVERMYRRPYCLNSDRLAERTFTAHPTDRVGIQGATWAATQFAIHYWMTNVWSVDCWDWVWGKKDARMRKWSHGDTR